MFSLALGGAQLLVPDRIAQLVGIDQKSANRALLRFAGARELMHGSLMLGARRTGLAAGTRVAGDLFDLSLLGAALKNVDRRAKPKTVAATAAVLGVTALDVLAAARDKGTAGLGRRPLELTAAITIAKPVQDVYEHWHDLTNLPTFMAHLRSVRMTGDRLSHWVAQAPLGGTVEWDAEITEDVPGKVTAWRSLKGATVSNSGRVRFDPAPGDRGTEVRVELEYKIPGGKVGDLVAKMLGEQPKQQVEDDLRRFKQVLETGEVIRSDGSPDGHLAKAQAAQREAQPMSERS